MLKPEHKLDNPREQYGRCHGCMGYLHELQDNHNIGIEQNTEGTYIYTVKSTQTGLFVCDECRLVYYLPELLKHTPT